MLLHASTHWKHGIDSTMWPMAVSYATYIYNNLPRANGISPSDVFFGTRVPRHKLRNLHVWGCPVYVLDPSLQAGKKIPRWEPRSKRGVFCGLSNIHLSEVPQVLNLTTGSITTQFHVIFDDRFTTVPSIAREEEPPSHWADLCLENTTFIPTDSNVPLSQEWRSSAESDQDKRTHIRSNRVHDDIASTTTATSAQPMADPLLLPNPRSSEGASSLPPTSGLVSSEEAPPDVTDTNGSTADTNGSTIGLRRSPRANKGQFSTTRYINEVFLAVVQQLPLLSDSDANLAYLAELQTDMDTSQPDVSDPRLYNARYIKKKTDPDSPTFHQAMSGNEADKYIEAMKEEVAIF